MGVCAPLDFFSSASAAVVVTFGGGGAAGFGSSFVSGLAGASCFAGAATSGCLGASGLGVSGFLSGVAAFFSLAVVAVVAGGAAAAGVTVGAFSFSGLDLTRHFSGSSKAAFSSASSSPDLAVFRRRRESERLGEKKRESCVLVAFGKLSLNCSRFYGLKVSRKTKYWKNSYILL